MICIAHVISSYLYPEFNEIFLGKLASHLQGPGEQVDQGLGGVHHDPQFFLFCSFFTFGFGLGGIEFIAPANSTLDNKVTF